MKMKMKVRREKQIRKKALDDYKLREERKG